MKDRKENRLAESWDEIILINDNYVAMGLRKGYIGLIIENLIDSKGFVLADFHNPISGDDIAILAQIDEKDFLILNDAKSDEAAVKAFRNLFQR